MKNLFSIFSIVTIMTLVISLASCTQEDLKNVSSEETTEQHTLLFNKIAVTTDENGYLKFVEDESVIQPIVQKLFTEKNQSLNYVDEFGFGIDGLGIQYFYAKEITSKRTKSVFIFLDDTNTLSKANSLGGTECTNVECCDDCVAHSSLGCTCHTITASCKDEHGTTGSCSGGSISIQVEPVGEVGPN